MWFGEFSASGRGRSHARLVFLAKTTVRSILGALSSSSMPRLEDFPVKYDPERRVKKPIHANRRREFADRKNCPELEVIMTRAEILNALRNDGAYADDLDYR
jgi:hypothetical protein